MVLTGTGKPRKVVVVSAPTLSAPLRLFWRMHRWVLRMSGGRLGGRLQGMPVLELTTRGRRSGEPRTVALQYLAAGDRMVVVGSHAGSDRHPAWWLNLRAHPEAEVRVAGRTRAIVAREADGDERNQLWSRLVAVQPNYAEYQQRTRRTIPVVVLEPGPPGP